MSKKILSVIMSLVLMLGTLGVMPAGAAERSAAGTGASKYVYNVLENNEIEITEYKGNETELIIPETLDGYTVTGIGGYILFSNLSVMSVTVPATVTSIVDGGLTCGDYLTEIKVDPENPVYDSRDNCNAVIETATDTLISGCSTTVIPDTVKSIGTTAFYGCYKLNEINFPDSVTSIVDNAFHGCAGLTELHIPAGITNIGEIPFAGCGGFKRITVDPENTVYDSRDNCNALIESSTDTLLFACVNTFIPDTVKIIDKFAFANLMDIKNIEIPDSVEIIREYAFTDCGSITSFTLPDSVKVIEDYAFSYNESLSSVTIPASVTQIGEHAFELSDEDLIIYGKPDSYAMTYAIEHGIRFIDMDNIPEMAYYLVGNMNDWKIDEKYKLERYQASPYAPYVLNNIKLTTLSEFKIVYTENGKIMRWYPDGTGNNYGENHEIVIDGRYDVYFYPKGNAFDTSGNNYITVDLIPALPYEYILGDVDGDKEATILDATYIQRFATKVNVPYTSADMIRGDIDGDEEVTVIDASFVQRSATRVYVPYPVGETV